MAGVTPTGFEAKRLADVISDAEVQLATIVDPASGETLAPDFDSTDPAMQVVKVPLDAVGQAWQALQLVFGQFDPNAATGPALWGLVELNGIEQQAAVSSTASVLFGGTPGAPVPAGTIVSDSANLSQWTTDATVFLDGTGFATAAITNTAVGPIAALAGTIVNIVTPTPGVTTVTNPQPATVGRFAETDAQLRQRRARSTQAPAASPVESVYANLANIPGVTYTRVYQNNTLVVDSRGIPGKSVAAVVVGGDDLSIAKTLLARTGSTSAFFGDSSLVLFDVQNEPTVVQWTRPAALPIYLRVQTRITNPSIFPVDGIQQIKDAIIAYAQGGAPALGIVDGFGSTGFPPGSLVEQPRLYTPLNYVPGHRVTSLTLGLTPSPAGTADIQVPWNQFPLFTAENILVEIVA